MLDQPAHTKIQLGCLMEFAESGSAPFDAVAKRTEYIGPAQKWADPFYPGHGKYPG